MEKLFFENSYLDICPQIPQLEGHLDSNQILKQANLSNLVEFYSDKIKTATGKYVNSNIDKNKNIDYWTLWNSGNISLLNVTNSYYGQDGHRIQPGNFIEINIMKLTIS